MWSLVRVSHRRQLQTIFQRKGILLRRIFGHPSSSASLRSVATLAQSSSSPSLAQLLKPGLSRVKANNPSSRFQTPHFSHNVDWKAIAQHKTNKRVAVWLFVIAGLVLALMCLGAATRLTRSGLSMVEWKFLGEKFPTNQQQWQETFDKYKQYPEYQRMNSDMTLGAFKFIYAMEYAHRALARFVGLSFMIPYLGLLVTRKLPTNMAARLGIGGALLVAQGLVGWWMVKSGLKHNQDPNAAVRVSPYRLSFHFGMAAALYTVLLSTGLRMWSGMTQQPRNLLSLLPVHLRVLAAASTLLITLTMFAGTFVAGTKAGFIYNEFPRMGSTFVPEDLTNPRMKPRWRQAAEHPPMVQFNHRFLATTTAVTIGALFIVARRVPIPLIRRPIQSMFVVTLLQYALGVASLLAIVPVSLGSLHQAGALALFSHAIWMWHAFRVANIQMNLKMAQHMMRRAMMRASEQKNAAAVSMIKNSASFPGARDATHQPRV